MMCAVGWVVPHVYMRVGRAGTGNGQVHLMCVLDLVLRGYLLQLVIRTRARVFWIGSYVLWRTTTVQR